MDINKWLNHDFNKSRTQYDYLEFEREYHELFKERTKKLGYSLIAFKKHHYCFTVVIQDNESKRYYLISISDVRFFNDDWFKKVLWKEISHAEDIVGKDSQRSSLYTLFDDIKEHQIKKPSY